MYVINSLPISLFQPKDPTVETLAVVNTMLRQMSCRITPSVGHVLGTFVDGTHQQNMITFIPTLDLGPTTLET